MASTAISAQGSTLGIGSTPVVIENIVSYSGFDGEKSEIDTTNLSSVAKESLAGLVDNGSFSFEFHPSFLAAAVGQEDLRDAAISGDLTEFVLTLPDEDVGTGTTLTFNAIVKNALSTSGGVDAALTGSASLKISGAVTIVPGT